MPLRAQAYWLASVPVPHGICGWQAMIGTLAISDDSDSHHSAWSHGSAGASPVTGGWLWSVRGGGTNRGLTNQPRKFSDLAIFRTNVIARQYLPRKETPMAANFVVNKDALGRYQWPPEGRQRKHHRP
jgi:hypothetical protein